MSHSAATRPPWLPTPDELEKILSSSDRKISLYSLSSSRNRCPIIEELLSSIVQRLPQDNRAPSLFEEQLAREHLAVDFQRILKRWCEDGLRKTLIDSQLREGFSAEIDSDLARGELEVRLGRPAGEIRVAIPSKRPGEDECELGMSASKMARTTEMGNTGHGEKDFRCPYNLRDPAQHVECAGKRFPNPRKLKEHIWRFTKPFKCPTCGEGFGREKTKAIHCDQRKVKCTEQETKYDGSYEQSRDRQIERAKNTQEILEIFEEYDQKCPQGSNYSSNFSPDALSPDEGSWSQPASPYDTKPNVSIWSSQHQHQPQSQRFMDNRQMVPLTIPFATPDNKSTYPTPPREQNIQTPVSPLETHMTDFSQHTTTSPTNYDSHNNSFSQAPIGEVQFSDQVLYSANQPTPVLDLDIPKIVISKDMMSPVRHTHGYHSPIYPSPMHQIPGSSTTDTDEHQMRHQSMPQFAFDQSQPSQMLSQHQRQDESSVMFSEGYGAFPPFQFRARVRK